MLLSPKKKREKVLIRMVMTAFQFFPMALRDFTIDFGVALVSWATGFGFAKIARLFNEDRSNLMYFLFAIDLVCWA